MLRPPDTAIRERKSLNGLWQFALDSDGAGRTEGWFAGPLPGSRSRRRSRTGWSVDDGNPPVQQPQQPSQ